MKIVLCLSLILFSGCVCPEKAAVPALKGAFDLISLEYTAYVQKDAALSPEAKAIKLRTVEKANALFAELGKAK